MIYNIPIDDIRYIQTNIAISNKEAIMASEIRKYKRLGAIALRPRRGFKTAGLVALAVAVLVAATAVFQFDTTQAASQVATGLNALETHAVAQDFSGSARTAGVWDLGTDAMTASVPDIPTHSNVAGSGTEEEAGPAREVYVWATFMTVGMATDGNMTYTGYMPGAALGTEGSLAHTSFTYADTDYTVLALFHQQVNGGFQQVVLSADKQLPENLVLYAGDDEFKVSESMTLGAKKNIHAWRVDSGPGWSEGQWMPVALLEDLEPEPASGPTGDESSTAQGQAAESQSANQEDDIDIPDVLVWSAMMTVGKSEIASIGYLGFVTGDWPDTGSIDNMAFTHSGVNYIVTALYHPIVEGNPNHLFLHTDKSLSGDLRLRAGADVFEVSDALILGPKNNIYHWYLDSKLDWTEGERIAVSLLARPQSGMAGESLVKRVPPDAG